MAEQITPQDMQELVSLLQQQNIDTAEKVQTMLEEKDNISPEDIRTLSQEYKQQAEEANETQDATENISQVLENFADQLSVENEQITGTNEMSNYLEQEANKKFNLIKQQQQQSPAGQNDPFGAEQNIEGWQKEQDYTQEEDLEDNEKEKLNPKEMFFPNKASLYRKLQEIDDPNEAIRAFQQAANDNQMVEYEGETHEALELIKEPLQKFYETDNTYAKEEMVDMVYRGLPALMKNQEDADPSPDSEITIQAPYKGSAMYENYIKETNEQIKKLAKKHVKQHKNANKKKTFNLIKSAQHHTDQNTIMWGPQEKRIDPFYRQPVSDWHIMERNKGFGQDVAGVWDIDWEAVWRGNVMDKYTRPYRDPDTGEWKGGYIHKRFEVDKWIPEGNNYQLLPGEQRKPVLPEYGVTEARMQSMRNNEPDRYNNASEPTNWNLSKSPEYAKINKEAKKINRKAQMGEQPGGMSDQFTPDVDPNANAQNTMEQMRNTDVDDIIQNMDPETMTQYVNAYEEGKWSDVFYYLGEDLPEEDFMQRMIADQVYLNLTNQSTPENVEQNIEQQEQPEMATAAKKKVN